jgi:hypothetical protein
MFGDYVRLNVASTDMLLPCLIASCPLTRQEHVVAGVASSFRLPSMDNFPMFRDKHDKLLSDPYEFLRQLERKLVLYGVPKSRYGAVLVARMDTRLVQDYIEHNILASTSSWSRIKDKFMQQYTDPVSRNELLEQLHHCTQRGNERVQAYVERFQSLVIRVAGREPTDTRANVDAFEGGLTPTLRADLAKFRASQTSHRKRPFEFTTLRDIYNCASILESGQQPRFGRRGSHHDTTTTQKRNGYRSSRQRHPGMNQVAQAQQPAADPSVNKIELVNNQPVNVNKKHGNSRGGQRGRGSHRGGRSGGRGGEAPTPAPSSPPSRGGHTSARGGFNTRSGRGGHLTHEVRLQRLTNRECFNCGRRGHQSAECTDTARMHALRYTAPVVASLQLRRSMHITSTKMSGCHMMLNDTGAQFSGISQQLVRKHRLAVRAPLANEPLHLTMADRSKTVKRVGTVEIPITIHFNGGKPRQPYSCMKVFEVMNMDYPFIIGVDLLPSLFPQDDIMDYLLLPSRITSPPCALRDESDVFDGNPGRTSRSHFPAVSTLQYEASVPTHVPTISATNQFNDYVDDRIAEHYSQLYHQDMDDLVRGTIHACALVKSRANVRGSPRANHVSVGVLRIDGMHEERVARCMLAAADDSFTLHDQITDIGIGDVPPQELPQKPVASTPVEREQEYAAGRASIMAQLAELLKTNEEIVGFCTGEGSIVVLTVGKQDEDKVFSRQYPLPQALDEAIDQCVRRWWEQGRIMLAPHGCTFNSPLLAVKKKDDQGRMTGVRVCLDVRKLNLYLLQNDRFQIPHIPDMLATLSGGCIFGEFDLSEAYFQFQLSETSRGYTAFTWKKQQYMFAACPYGIKHIPSLFQRFIAQLFVDMPFVFTYIDNICFSSKTWKEHGEQAAAIIARLNSVNLRIKPSSVNLGNYQIKLLGHIITPFGISMDPEKRDIIMSWPRPSTGAELASFLGLGTFLRDHIRYYADLTAPFEKIKKSSAVQWTPLLQQQWDTVRRAFATAPFLAFPDFSRRFVVATDASQTGVGGVLYQPDSDENVITATNIVAIVSKQLNESQRRYPV